MDVESDVTDVYVPTCENGWHNDERWLAGVTCKDVARCVGIMRAGPPSEDMLMEAIECRLLEVFSVSLIFKTGRPMHVYGSIIVDLEVESYCLYKRSQDDPEFIEHDGTLTLQGPKDLVCSWRFACIYVDLWELGGTQVSKGVVVHNSSRTDFTDSRLSGMVRGLSGFAFVHFSVYEYGVIADIEATLMVSAHDGSETDVVCLCGSLVTCYDGPPYATEDHEKYYQTRLFNKPACDVSSGCTLKTGKCSRGESVKLGAPITLLRLVVAVPALSSVPIKANLKNCEGKPIVVGSQSWEHGQKGESMKMITSELGGSHMLQVKVTWRIPKW